MRRLTRIDLIQPIYDACKAPKRFAVGVEWEKEAVRSSGRRVTFDEPGGVESILQALLDRFGWEPYYEADRLIALTRGGASVTIEPGAQVEYSSTPQATLRAIEAELRRHLTELQEVTRGDDLLWMSTAYPSIQDVAEIPFVPKARYAIMRQYLPGKGRLAHGMMKGTTSVQAALDFASEADCGRKMRAALGVGPIVSAMFANSPLLAGREAGTLSFRAHCWLETDPDRTGLLSEILAGGFSFARYVEWLLSVPMMFWKVDGRIAPCPPVTFADWMRDGIDGRLPTIDDWTLHMNSVFPEVRLQRYIEIRGGDNGPWPNVLAVPALWKGLLYDDHALDRALEVAETIPFEKRTELFRVAADEGLAGSFLGRPLAAWAEKVLELAEAGLMRQGTEGRAEVAYLRAVRERVERRASPGADVLARWQGAPDRAAFLRGESYPPIAELPVVVA